LGVGCAATAAVGVFLALGVAVALCVVDVAVTPPRSGVEVVVKMGRVVFVPGTSLGKRNEERNAPIRPSRSKMTTTIGNTFFSRD